MSHIEAGDNNFGYLQDLIQVAKHLTLKDYQEFVEYVVKDSKKIVLTEYPDSSIKDTKDVDDILKN